MNHSIYHSKTLYNCFLKLHLYRCFSHTVMKHILAIVISVFSAGYHGKTVDFEKNSPCHRTTIAHFLNHGKWDHGNLENMIKAAVIHTVYGESRRTKLPVFCMIDDTISSKARPSSQALHPMEDAYFHQSHLKKKMDYGHQAVAVMLSCNGLVLNYSIIMYDKTKSKIKLVQDIADELPVPPCISYLLCDSWYTCPKVMDAFVVKGFYTIGALRTNRIFYPCGIRQKISSFASALEKTDGNVRLVTVGSRQYYIHVSEVGLNGIENAVVILSYPKDAFGVPKALRAFLCTDVSLDAENILSVYTERWPVEVFFRESKNVLALDRYQIRTAQGIRRYWLLMSLCHLICCTEAEGNLPFEKGFTILQKKVQQEKISYIYECGRKYIPLEHILDMVG